MSKILVLTEKPSVGREIAKVLGCRQNGGGFISGDKYIVTWALGHLVTLADPEVYNDKYKSWRLEDLPMLPEKLKLVVIKQTASQFKVVKSLLERGDISELVIATDSGREGELVARWIIMKSGFKKPIKRLWISSQTEKAIKEGFDNLKPSKEYDNLFLSAQSRAEADWVVGLNVTRALTCKYNAQLSAGRVQTPTLAMIVEREREIQRFVPKEYWTINADANVGGTPDAAASSGAFKLRWQDKASGQTRIFDKTVADSIMKKLTGQSGKISEVKKEAKREQPPLAYDLTELQRDGNKKYGFSAKQTLNTMQALYETHKLVTYPRTDSRYLTDDIVPTLVDRLRSISVGPYTAAANSVIRAGLKVTKRLIDNSKVSDHHAIIPTEQFVNLQALSREERAIYDLIVKRFIAVLSSDFEYEQTTVKAIVAGEVFTAKGKIIKSKGWKNVYLADPETDSDADSDADDGPDQSLPDIKNGEAVALRSIKLASARTKPPARYTEATLLTAMESPGKFIENEALKQEIGGGLGTPATRADIIEKLFNSFYMERKGKEIIPTSKGIQLIDIVPITLKSPELTAKWEQKLSLISKGKGDSKVFVSEMKTYASELVSNVVGSSNTYKHDNLTREKCPTCGKFLLEVTGKRGKMTVCQDRECGYRKSANPITRGPGGDRARKDSVNKNEVNAFLQSQEKAEGLNTGLANKLANWKG